MLNFIFNFVNFYATLFQRLVSNLIFTKSSFEKGLYKCLISFLNRGEAYLNFF